MKIRPLIGGLATFFPIVNKLCARKTGGSLSARYCYSVWLRHLVMTSQKGGAQIPSIVAELGPGDSLGMGLAALLSGADLYYALDLVETTNVERNVEVFDELVELFGRRERVPDELEFPRIKPYLDSYEFPSQLLSNDHLDRMLAPDRVKLLRDSILNIDSSDSVIKFAVPWHGTDIIVKDSVDHIFSQAVFEHVDDLENTYNTLHLWLKPGGLMSHQIDFKSHGTAELWNGHWQYSDWIWKMIRGRRPYLINREPYSRGKRA